MQMRRESISHLTGIRRQIHINLRHLRTHHLSRALIATELVAAESGALSIAACNGPEDEVRNIECYGLLFI
jgi:hypothetical protein